MKTLFSAGCALAVLLVAPAASAQQRAAPAPQALDPAKLREEVQSLVPALGPNGEPRLGTVRIYTTDLDRAIHFYQTVFGLRLIHRIEQSGEAALAFPGAGPPGLVLARTDKPRGNGGLAIAVADLDAVLARVPGTGGTVPRPPSDVPQVGLRIGSIVDPDGATIEVVQRLPPR